MNAPASVADLERLTELMAESLAARLPSAERDGTHLRLGLGTAVGELEAECAVAKASITARGHAMAELHLLLYGGPLGRARIPSSWVGFGATADAAVIHGVNDWVSGPYCALQDAFGHGPPVHEIDIAGSPYRIHVSPLVTRGVPPAELEAPDWELSLVMRLIEAGGLPLVLPDAPTVVSSFAARLPDGELVTELRVNGRDWPHGAQALTELPWPHSDDYASVRELAVISPARGEAWDLEEPADAPASRLGRLPGAPVLQRALEALAAADSEHARFGASRHHYRLAPPLSEDAVMHIEARGITLPADYREFISTVGASGAGPYLGLIAPDTEAQLADMRGPFSYEERWEPGAPGDLADTRGTLMLAHMGCGHAALLVVAGPARGQVWADLRAAGAGLVKTHDSFTDWYLDWLYAEIGNWPMAIPIEPGWCKFVESLSALISAEETRREMEPGTIQAEEALAELPEGSIAAVASGLSYFDDGDAMDLCPRCVALARHVGVRTEQLAAGVLPRQARRPPSRPAGPRRPHPTAQVLGQEAARPVTQAQPAAVPSAGADTGTGTGINTGGTNLGQSTAAPRSFWRRLFRRGE